MPLNFRPAELRNPLLFHGIRAHSPGLASADPLKRADNLPRICPFRTSHNTHYAKHIVTMVVRQSSQSNVLKNVLDPLDLIGNPLLIRKGERVLEYCLTFVSLCAC